MATFKYLIIRYIFTHEYKICCLIISDFVYLSLESGLFSCSSLLPNLSLKISFVCVSCLILLLNSKSFSVNLKTVHKHYFSSKPSQKTVDKGGPYNIIVYSVNIGHLMLALYLIITWSNDIYYGNMFFLESDQWKNSKLCALNFFFITTYILLIPHCLCFLALSRFMVIKYPFDSKFKSTKFVFKCLVILFSSIIGIAGAYTRATDTSLSFLCSPFIDPTFSYLEKKIFTSLTFSIQLFSASFISYLHYKIVQLLKKSQRIRDETGALSWSLKLQLILLSVSNIICWIPSTIIHLSSIFLERYPNELLMWTTVFAVPINSVINPITFIVKMKKK